MKTLLLSLCLLCSCSAPPKEIIVSTKRQIVQFGSKVYKCSTSKFGLGTEKGSNKTPTGKFQIARKIGEGMPVDTGFKAQRPVKCITGRDGIVSRVLVLDGLEPDNANTAARHVYIHGTPYVSDLGKPVSYGCVRLNPNDIKELCESVPCGTIVEIK